MKAYRYLTAMAALLCCSTLSSCIFSAITDSFTRDEYPGERPPHVIADNNGTPASNSWLQADPYGLPLAGSQRNKTQTASDGLPYGLPCEFSDIVVSPYEPHHLLDYKGTSVGAKVWDPYSRKPFYIPRLYTFN